MLSVENTVVKPQPLAVNFGQKTAQVAIITHGDDHPFDKRVIAAFDAKERQLVETFNCSGLNAERVAWNNPTVDWSRYSLGIIRSVWDYFDQLPAFKRWLNQMQQQTQTQFWNPPAMVLWNIDKTYLQQLEGNGVPIIPTVFVKAGQKTDLTIIAQEKGWKSLVIKPTVSGGAKDTYKVAALESSDKEKAVLNFKDGQKVFDGLVATREMMVQPFLPNIQQGERSFVFFNDKFSHAILKIPKTGEYRSHVIQGGHVESYTPEPTGSEMAFAQHVLAVVKQIYGVLPLCSRVDFILDDENHPRLIELELIEPELYFETDPQANKRFQTAIEEKLHMMA